MKNIIKNILLLTLLLNQIFAPEHSYAATKAIIKADITEGQESVPNFLKGKGHYEKTVNGTTAYADAAGTRPVDGTGGSPTLTCTRTTSSPLDGDGSLLITKDAANRQGQGCAIQFTIDSAYKAKVLQIEMDYIVGSGTFTAGTSSTDSDLIVYIYDVTNSTLIEPSSIKFLASSTTLPDKFVANFQTSATGTTYNLILHQATTSSSAYTFKADNLQVKPSQYVYGTPISDWQSYTPTGSLTTNTTYTGMRRRVGGNEEFRIKADFSGTNTQGAMTLNLPVTIDTTKIPGTINGATVFGIGSARDSGSADFDLVTAYNSTTSVTVLLKNSSATYGYYAQVNTSTNVPMTIASGDSVEVFLSVPVVGYSSSVQQSDGFSSREITAQVYRASTSQTINSASDVKIQWNAENKDSTSSFDSTTNYRFVVPSSGTYSFGGNIVIGASGSSTIAFAHLYKNGSPRKTIGSVLTSTSIATTIAISTQDDAVAGDYYEIFLNSNSVSMPVLSDASIYNGSQWFITKLQSPQTMSMTERVSFSVNTSTSSVSTSSPFVFTNVVDNTHGAYSTSTGVFTAPYRGFYFFTATYYTGATSNQGVFYKNGTTQVAQGIATVSSAQVGNISYGLTLNAGETIELRAITSATASGGAILNNFTGFLVK